MALAITTPAEAGLGSIRATLEPSMAEIQTPTRSLSFGYGAGGSFELGLSDQLGVTVFGNWQNFPKRSPELTSTSMGATLLYRLDAWRITPYVEAGMVRTAITPSRGTPPPAELVPTLGLGFEVIYFDWLLWGAVMRYYPLFSTDLLTAPAFATLHIRIGVALDWGK